MPVAEEIKILSDALRDLQQAVIDSYANNNEIKDVVGSPAPPLNRTELGKMAGDLADRVAACDTYNFNEKWTATSNVSNIDYIKLNILPHLWNGNWIAAYTSYRSVLDRIDSSLSFAFQNPVVWDKVDDRESMPPQLLKRLRSVKAQVNAVEIKATNLDDQVGTINSAYDAALNLPTDLAALEEARQQTTAWREDAQRDAILSADALKSANADLEAVRLLREEAKKLVADTADAYSAATTKGLGQSFQERADRTANSMWIWVLGLIAALIASAALGINRVSIVQKMIEQHATSTLTQLHTILAVVAVAAPVWFAWIATKQIGQRFRLSEDYAYKAAVARAYEGYRREAARFDDPTFTNRLFKTALDRLDEPPLRYVEHETHGSPMHEWWKMRIASRRGSVPPLPASNVPAPTASSTPSSKPAEEAE